MKWRILFVDDDLPFLDGLRGLLKPLEKDWTLAFAEGPAGGLECLDRGTFDVVVADLDMAASGGRQVLEEAARLQPAALRIAYSGPDRQERLAQGIGLVHQALPRPFRLEDFAAMVDNASRLGKDIVDGEVKGVIGRVDHLPTVPHLFRELREALAGREVTVKAVADLIGQDVGMSARLLNLVNSAFFGLRRTVESVQEAVAFLGTETIKALVLAHGLFEQIGPLGTEAIALEDIWRHSLSVARGAQSLAAMEGLARPLKAEAFMGGLLHDVGILVLAKNFPARYDRVVRTVEGAKLSVSAAEQREFGLGHAEVGAFLLGLWGVQSSVLRAVSLHHRPSVLRVTRFDPVMAIHLADELCGARGHHLLFERSELDERALANVGVRDHMAGWRKVLGEPGW